MIITCRNAAGANSAWIHNFSRGAASNRLIEFLHSAFSSSRFNSQGILNELRTCPVVTGVWNVIIASSGGDAIGANVARFLLSDDDMIQDENHSENGCLHVLFLHTMS